MSIYLCKICDNMKDGDYDSPTEYKGGLICEFCATELEVNKDLTQAQEQQLQIEQEQRDWWQQLDDDMRHHT